MPLSAPALFPLAPPASVQCRPASFAATLQPLGVLLTAQTVCSRVEVKRARTAQSPKEPSRSVAAFLSSSHGRLSTNLPETRYEFVSSIRASQLSDVDDEFRALFEIRQSQLRVGPQHVPRILVNVGRERLK